MCSVAKSLSSVHQFLVRLLKTFSRDYKKKATPVLNDDMCVEILVRLPIKSIFKFKLVCKGWHSLIVADDFHRRFHSRPRPSLILNSNDSSLFFSPNIQNASMVPSSIKLPTKPKTWILSSCNGLLLLERHGCTDLFVYNPTTEHSRRLSLNRRSKFKFRDKPVWFHLIFDPSKSLHYKIVYIRVELDSVRARPLYEIEVFSSESGAWKVREPFVGHSRSDSVVHCTNIVYYHDTWHPSGSLFCYNVERNVLWFVACPSVSMLKGKPYSRLPQLSNGCLYYSCLLSLDESGELSAALWKLQGNGEWLLKYHDGVPRLPEGRDSRLLRIFPESSTVLIHVPGAKIVAYNFVDKSYNQLLDLKNQLYKGFYDVDSRLSVHHFAETLAPV